MWYKRHEQVFRMGIWYQGTSVAPVVSSLASFGFVHYTESNPNLSFKSWQILFLLFGLITVAVGILVVLFLPDNPMKSRLSNEEKVFIIERVRENQTGIENKRLKSKQVMEVMTDYKTWLLSLIVITTNVPNGAVSSFSSIIIEKYDIPFPCLERHPQELTNARTAQQLRIRHVPDPASQHPWQCRRVHRRRIWDVVGWSFQQSRSRCRRPDHPDNDGWRIHGMDGSY